MDSNDDFKKITNDLEYDHDDYINKPLLNIMTFIIYIIIIIYILIIINALSNFILYLIKSSYYNTLINEKENLLKNITENYNYRILNYVYCFEKNDSIEKYNNIEEKKEVKKEDNSASSSCEKPYSIQYFLEYYNNNNNFFNEKDFNFLLEYNYYSIILKLISIIVCILLFSIIYNFLINFLLKKKNYKISGYLSIYDFITKNNNSLVIRIIYIFCLGIVIYFLIYKFLFIDIIYTNIYNIYTSILQLDIFILNEAEKINKYDSYFFIMLKGIDPVKRENKYFIDKKYEENIIKNNIELTENPSIKTSKYLILGFYKYIVNISQDITNINKLNNFIIYKKDNLEYNKLISLRDLLPMKIDKYNIENKINEYFSFDIINEDSNDAKELIDYKNMLINILNTIDDKLDKNDISNNIKIYSIIQFIIPIIIILLVFTAIYNNNYDDVVKNNDRNNYFGFIYYGIKQLILIIDKIKSIISKKDNEEKIPEDSYITKNSMNEIIQ